MSDGRVLVVDDDEAIRSFVADALDFEGYPVEVVSDGEQALAAIERARPAVVLLDMRMPVLDGWGVARRLAERGISVPVVVMTAARDARQWAEEIGAVAHLPKPFDLATLLAIVDQTRAAPP